MACQPWAVPASNVHCGDASMGVGTTAFSTRADVNRSDNEMKVGSRAGTSGVEVSGEFSGPLPQATRLPHATRRISTLANGGIGA